MKILVWKKDEMTDSMDWTIDEFLKYWVVMRIWVETALSHIFTIPSLMKMRMFPLNREGGNARKEQTRNTYKTEINLSNFPQCNSDVQFRLKTVT